MNIRIKIFYWERTVFIQAILTMETNWKKLWKNNETCKRKWLFVCVCRCWWGGGCKTKIFLKCSKWPGTCLESFHVNNCYGNPWLRPNIVWTGDKFLSKHSGNIIAVPMLYIIQSAWGAFRRAYLMICRWWLSFGRGGEDRRIEHRLKIKAFVWCFWRERSKH